MDKVPLRNDPKKQTKERENRTVKSEMEPVNESVKKGSSDYNKWEKFDVVRFLAYRDTTNAELNYFYCEC